VYLNEHHLVRCADDYFDISIVLLCCQVHREAASVFYDINSFMMSKPGTVTAFLEEIGRVNASHIKYINAMYKYLKFDFGRTVLRSIPTLY
jgi:hypothetical protein